jgi:hypothetical protein
MYVDVDQLKRELDCIYVDKSQIGEILQWWKDNKNYDGAQYPSHFIFTEGIVVYKSFATDENGHPTDANHIFKVLNENSFENAIVRSNKMTSLFYADRADKNRVTTRFRNEAVKSDGFDLKYQEDVANYMGQSIIALLAYISGQEKERVIVESERVTIKRGKTSYVKKRRIITITNKIFEYTRKSGIREFIRHAESWGVRGHWRQYKSGKRVWVTPYKKGVGEKEGKEYMIQ